MFIFYHHCHHHHHYHHHHHRYHQGLTPDESVPLLLAVYEVVTQSHSYYQTSKHIPVSYLQLKVETRLFTCVTLFLTHINAHAHMHTQCLGRGSDKYIQLY